MDFNWRLESKKNYYNTLVEWWKEHKAFNNKIIEYNKIPNRIFIVSKDNEDLFAITVYVSDSTICWIGWITGNPKAKLRNKIGALDYLHNIIGIVMKSQGFETIISKTNENGLIRPLENNDFEMVEKTNFYIKNI